ncbi:HIT family protein [Actinomadura chibensis]|uniref:HIT family protein n=1 Tax=Actinomadura chibensis TaxID=392828 RepID=A0A5D0NYI8_9ACTN|nr:HIT family protein [Actinomadura chibensis]TYB49228.1 HIT family protein [Actinomadura chibensis]
MDDCTFCGIVAGTLPSYQVAADEHAVAFLDIAPANPGHTLVVPRAHAADIWEITDADHVHVARLVRRVAALLEARLGPDGLNVVHSSGEAAGQEVFHFHVHLVPRWNGDDVRPMWDPAVASPEELTQVRRRLTGS